MTSLLFCQLLEFAQIAEPDIIVCQDLELKLNALKDIIAPLEKSIH